MCTNGPKIENIVSRNKMSRASTNKNLNITTLTTTETKVANLLIEGLSNKEIANFLNVHVGTVKFHLSSVYQITKTKSRSELIVFYYKNGQSFTRPV